MKNRLPKFSTFAFTILIIFVLWANIPNSIPIKFSLFGKKIDTAIPLLKIDTVIFGEKIQKNFQTKLGLDLKGGSHLLFQADTSKIPAADKKEAVESARNIIERRVNFYGVSEPSVQTITSNDTYRISVDLPGVGNIADAIKLIGQTAQLNFTEQASSEAKIATQSPPLFNITKPTGLTGKDVKKATVQFDNNTGQPVVNLEFSKKGAALFEKITGRNVGKPVGIFIDNLVISAPVVQQKITGGSAIITGQFTVDEAKNLATAINSGALPIPVKLIEQRNIGPTLGKEAIQRSMIAGIIGLISVVSFMIIYYGRLGIIASFGLLIYGLISMAIFRAIPIVFTLPGIAGFILSIGMAVDSNILIFERIKEEQRKGKDFRTAFAVGFGKAIDAIKDANIATLLVAFILFNPFNWDFFPQFGLIRGFALTLSIGVLTSLFTGVVITKKIIQIVFINNKNK